MPRSYPTTSRISPRSTRWGLALALLVAACGGKKAQTQAPTTAPTAPAASTPAVEDDLDARLALLTTRLEEARVQHHIPGMAVAVVKGDEIVFAKGFGHADLQAKREVTPETLFAVGSTTKAFTSTLVAMMIDEGKMSWDDPITKHLPEFALKPRPPKEGDEAPTLTVRDMLSHRAGFTRMSLLWAGGAVRGKDLYAAASQAEPWAPYGKEFLYNNVTYASAGEAAARAAGMSWDQLLYTRLLDPLGMGSTTVSTDDMAADPRHATGYRWREVSETHEALPMRNLDAIGPAGAINSNVLDMAQWLRLQLSRGTHDGERLVSAERIDDTWSSQMEVGSGIRYGMGWMLGDWQGHRVVEHGGNIDGYAAEVGMLPDDGIGYVMLTNISATPLQRESLGIVWESMLGELPKDQDDAPALDLRPYTGKYVADFASFDDARFTVSAEGGKLFVDVPGQTKFELEAPDAEGKWAFALTDTIKVSFDLEGEGKKAQVLHMYQGGFDFELPRVGYSFPPDFEPEEVAAQIGRYKKKDGPLEASVTLEQGRLVADIKGQMAFVLRKPGEDGRWRFRAKDDIAVSFRETKGAVDALIIHEGKDEVVLERVATKAKPLPTVAQLLRKAKVERFGKKLEKMGMVELTGKVRMPSSAIEGTFRIVFDAERRHRVEMDFGKFGRTVDTYDGKTAWSVSTLGPATEHQGKYLKQAKLGGPLLMGDWTQGFDEAVVEGREGEGKEERIRVLLRAKDLPPTTILVDPKTGDVVASKGNTLAEGVGVIPTQSKLSEHRTVSGLRVPHRVQTQNQHSGATILEVQTVKKAKGDPAELFSRATL